MFNLRHQHGTNCLLSARGHQKRHQRASIKLARSIEPDFQFQASLARHSGHCRRSFRRLPFCHDLFEFDALVLIPHLTKPGLNISTLDKKLWPHRMFAHQLPVNQALGCPGLGRSAPVLGDRHRLVELRYRAQRRRYIGDKGHEVRPSLMRKAAIDCSLFPDASDFVRCWRRWGRRDWRRPNYACACERPLLERPTNVAPRRTSTLMICLSRDKRNEGAETTTTWQ
jgi:hypothetical protein